MTRAIDLESALALIMQHYQGNEGAGWHYCDVLSWCPNSDIDLGPIGTLQRRGDELVLKAGG